MSKKKYKIKDFRVHYAAATHVLTNCPMHLFELAENIGVQKAKEYIIKFVYYSRQLQR